MTWYMYTRIESVIQWHQQFTAKKQTVTHPLWYPLSVSRRRKRCCKSVCIRCWNTWKTTRMRGRLWIPSRRILHHDTTPLYAGIECFLYVDRKWPLHVSFQQAAWFFFVLMHFSLCIYRIRPMDLLKMEERLDNGQYQTFTDFRNDFKLIVNNCRLYNGQNNGKTYWYWIWNHNLFYDPTFQINNNVVVVLDTNR